MTVVKINNLDYVEDFPKDLEKLKNTSIPKKYYLKVYCTQCSALLKKNKFTYLRDIRPDGNIYCKSCSLRNQDLTKRNETFKKTCLKKFGVENPFQSDICKEKSKETNKAKYGTEYAQQSDIVKLKIKETIDGRSTEEKERIAKKRKQTNTLKYGVESPLQNEDIKQKQKETTLKKYGVSSFLKTEDCKDAFRNKYNVENISQTSLWKNKVREKSLGKYDTEWFTQSNSVKEKSRNSCISKYGVPYYAQSDKFKKELKDKVFIWQKEALEKRDLSKYFITFYCENNEIFLKCLKCDKSWPLNKVGQSSKYFICDRCFPSGLPLNRSSYEEFILKILNKYSISYECNNRQLLDGKEIDIFLANYNIGIEIDDIYWHSLKDRYYHKVKNDIAENKGIKLIHLTDKLIDNYPDLVENFIKNIISKDVKTIYARKCIIKEINTEDYRNFCNKYHLQGYTIAKIKLGLYYNNELVQIMSFSKPRFNKNYQWELIREASKSGIRIVGGKAKLLKFFERVYKPESLISYCDRRWFDGHSYIDLGFKFIENTLPSYNYYKGGVVLTRYQCQKHNLSKLLENFDNSKTEYQNMLDNGYYRMFDCGQKVFVKMY